MNIKMMRVVEECSELIQALCKAKRFGWFNFHPDRPSSTNIEDVIREINDVRETINTLDAHIQELLLSQSNVTDETPKGE